MSLPKLQRRLKALGLYSGAVGDANAATREAIQKYQDGDFRDAEIDRLLELRARG